MTKEVADGLGLTFAEEPLVLSSSANVNAPGIVIKQVEFGRDGMPLTSQKDVMLKMAMGGLTILAILMLLCRRISRSTKTGRRSR